MYRLITLVIQLHVVAQDVRYNMAKIVNEVIVIELSKLIKNNQEDPEQLINENFLENLEAVLSELVAPGVVVELVRK